MHGSKNLSFKNDQIPTTKTFPLKMVSDIFTQSPQIYKDYAQFAVKRKLDEDSRRNHFRDVSRRVEESPDFYKIGALITGSSGGNATLGMNSHFKTSVARTKRYIRIDPPLPLKPSELWDKQEDCDFQYNRVFSDSLDC